MLVLDRSGSMDEDPSGNFTTPSKLDIAKTTLNKLVAQYGDRIPFGFTAFASTASDCSVGVDVEVKPKDGTKAAITSAVTAIMTTGSTNTGPAIDAVSALPEMNDSARPGSYILLITDGEPNCPLDVSYAATAIAKAATKGIKTFVVGFGALPDADKGVMNMMATAGQEPCTGTACNGQMFYAAENDAGLQAAIDAISNTILGEFGGLCDDSCYANGCPNAGEICVKGMCKPDPCVGVQATCAPGDYCYTDGSSAGTCTAVCPQTCPMGQSCTLSGCGMDPCASVVCDATATCQNGVCVTSTCKPACVTNQYCLGNTCVDDPCLYVQCPMGATCTPHKGTCVAGTGDGNGAHRDRSGGCGFAPGRRSEPLILFVLLFAIVGAASLRRASRRP